MSSVLRAVSDALSSCFTQSELQGKTLYVAYSGGMDSTVLLHVLVRLSSEFGYTVHAIHVHHGLQATANVWQEHCMKFCKSIHIPLMLYNVTVSRYSGLGLEASARHARYGVFCDNIPKLSHLFLAHHLRDQAETFFLRLLRGSGAKGLSSMQPVSKYDHLTIHRPLLAVAYHDMRSYAEHHDLPWVTDPSNDDYQFERNYIRHKVLPVFDKWPSFYDALYRSCQNLAMDASTISYCVVAVFKEISMDLYGNIVLDRAGFNALNMFMRVQVLRLWLLSSGYYPLSSQRLDTFIVQTFSASQDKHPLVSTKQYKLITSGNKLCLFDLSLSLEHTDFDQPWSFSDMFIGSVCAMSLQFTEQSVDRLSFSSQFTDVRVLSLSVIKKKSCLTAKQLKRIWSIIRIPLPLRAFVPFVFADGVLIAVASTWVGTASNRTDYPKLHLSIKWSKDVVLPD